MKEPDALVLIVHDDDPGRYLLGRFLRQGAFRVVEACDGAEALHLATRERPDLAVLDVKLPDLSGYEVARRLRNEPATAGLGLIFVSAFFMAATLGDEPGEGDAYLALPLDPVELLTTVKRVLHTRRVARAALEDARW